MNYDKKLEITKEQNQLVIKANEVVRKARYQLSLQELKIMQYCFSKVKPTDKPDSEYCVSIKDFCMCCGLDYKNGKNYENVKKVLKGLRDKSMWILQDDGSETTVGWLGKVNISRGSGKIRIKFDEDMSKYIYGLFNNYTQFTLLNILPMKSAYSVRIYELLKSYTFVHSHKFETEELKKVLMCEHYVLFGNFRQKVLEPATREINKYSDISISWQPIKDGRTVKYVEFFIQEKEPIDKLIANGEAYDQIEGQLNLEDYFK